MIFFKKYVILLTNLYLRNSEKLLKPIKVLYIASEVVPFAKTGGVADVAGAFPVAMKELGQEVRVIMPKYKIINERKYILREVIRLKDIEIPLGKEPKKINVKSAFIPDSKVQIYFIDYKPYFFRDGLYGDAKSGKEYKDNESRFILFCKGVLETLKLLFWQPDIIHCNDWQTALTPLFLKTIYKNDPFFKKTSSILTIHNPISQGVFKSDVIEQFGLPEDFKETKELITDDGKVNFLKIGIRYADIVNTVSEQFAKEIQSSSEYGFGLEKVLKDRDNQIIGILNGVDYNAWSPEADPIITTNYSFKNLALKEENKKALLKKVGLPYNHDVPVIGFIARLTAQKGIDLICKAIPELAKSGAQYIILGTGEKRYSTILCQAMKNYPDIFSIHLTFNVVLSHLIEAGADIFLAPSQVEPCGMNQLYSLKYGTVPIVRSTGGLADTIQDFDPDSGTGNGFTFKKYDVTDLSRAIKQAVSIYKDSALWKIIMRNGMKENHSWLIAGKKYLKLYSSALKNSG